MKSKDNNKKSNDNAKYYKWVFIFVVIFVVGYFLINSLLNKGNKNFIIKDNKQNIENIPEPQFVKHGELKFISKEGNKLISKIEIEVADDEKETTQGLMYRKYMDENKGMLFIFNVPEKHSFWMKNTYIPLDIIFVNESKEIVKIHKNTKPLNDKLSYPSYKPILYTVEVNAGYTDKHGIKEGDKIDFSIQ